MAKQNKNKREKKTKKKKKSKILKKILISLLIILIALIVWIAYKTQKNGGGMQGLLSTLVGHNEETLKNLGSIQVLLMGVSTDNGGKLTDTIIVGTYDPKNQKASLCRNLYQYQVFLPLVLFHLFQAILHEDEHTFYNSICNNVHSCLDLSFVQLKNLK